MDIGEDFEKGLESNRIEHSQYVFAGAEQLDVLLGIAIPVFGDGVNSRPTFFHGAAVFATEYTRNAV